MAGIPVRTRTQVRWSETPSRGMRARPMPATAGSRPSRIATPVFEVPPELDPDLRGEFDFGESEAFQRLVAAGVVFTETRRDTPAIAPPQWLGDGNPCDAPVATVVDPCDAPPPPRWTDAQRERG